MNQWLRQLVLVLLWVVLWGVVGYGYNGTLQHACQYGGVAGIFLVLLIIFGLLE